MNISPKKVVFILELFGTLSLAASAVVAKHYLSLSP